MSKTITISVPDREAQQDSAKVQQTNITKLISVPQEEWQLLCQIASKLNISLKEDQERILEFVNSKKAVNQLIFDILVDYLHVGKRITLLFRLLNSIGIDMVKNGSDITMTTMDNLDGKTIKRLKRFLTHRSKIGTKHKGESVEEV
jgi:hypothetical protein